jgi:hypothetical protein
VGCAGWEGFRTWDMGNVARDSLRDRGMANAVGVVATFTGESGTVGKMSRGVGRRLVLDIERREVSKVDLKAVAGTGGNLKEDLVEVEGAEGGASGLAWVVPNSPSLEPSDCKWASRGEGRALDLSKPPPTPSNSCSSSSSTRFSLSMLFDVITLAMDPVRLRAEYRLFQADPIPMPEPTEEEEDLRAKMRSSMALSRALASRCISTLSCSTSSRSEASSSIFRRRLQSSSVDASKRERSDGVGDEEGPRRTFS